MNKKKGISPLIATVLIIGFTIVLAAVVMQWGGAFVRSLTEQQGELATTTTTCMQMSFDLTEAKYIKDPAGINFKVTNNIDKSIPNFVVLLEQISGSSTLTSTCLVGPFETRTCTITGALILEPTDKLKIIPMITLNDGTLKGCSADTGKEVVIT